MEERASFRSAMVSRLPKFGGRCSGGGSSALSNGSAQVVTPAQDGKTSPPATCPNSAIPASSFSLKWKRDEGRAPAISATPTWLEDEDKAKLSSCVKEAKNGSPATPKMKRSGSLMLAASSPKAIPKQSLKMSPKVGSKMGPSSMDGAKIDHNSSNIPAPTGSESRLVRPKLGSSSLRSSSQDSLSQSSDSLKFLPVDNMVRSNSFTHFKQIPSPTSQPMTRSFSFNRAVELAKPLANTQLRPPKNNFLRPPQLSNGRIGLGLGAVNGTLGGSGGLGGALQCSRIPSGTSSMPTLSIPPSPSTPTALKKHLLPSCSLTKSLRNSAGSFGYRLTRPGQVKPEQKPLFFGRVKGTGPSAVSECGTPSAVDIELTVEADKRDFKGDIDGSCGDGEKRDGESGVPSQSCGLAAGETLEEMSFSSASSLDRGDGDEALLDDFYSAEDVFSDGDLPDSGNTQNTTQSLHSGTLDWDNMGLEGYKEESPMEDSQGPLLLSPNLSDVLQASSVELSPSNSSGGTYMWDEDGLEPFMGNGTHQCGSYDNSELNSLDILNNLDSPGSAQLDDDDLMLDVDLSEDGPHGTDGMSNIEHVERSSQQGQRRKCQRRSGPNHLHPDRRAPVLQASDGIKVSAQPQMGLSDGRQPCCTPVVDELTLEYMTQDCNSLKNQLLRLKMLLQLEDTDSPPDVPVEIEDNTTSQVLQFEELIKEVQMLRAELRSRDGTIAQLTLQCHQLKQQQEQMPPQGQQIRCHCHHQRAPSSLHQGERQTDNRKQHHYDKATQTYWRSTRHTGLLPTQLLSPWQGQHQGLTCAGMLQRRQRVEQLVQYFFDTACLKYYSLSAPTSASTSTREEQ
ncbi:serine-rich coiled-coil domain-containing protein 2 isoform X3 [Takifugu rubripes]|uniref:serine-rich coiled-coil domain-containing protein 2 isoform X3 n=1 Tax=Takifugu rubripes TaxID=31033 RepID=UPI00114585EA|nr:serine-rich coiled-coil domain-containing protein 2 isoform X3 [Takifugu rubripes]